MNTSEDIAKNETRLIVEYGRIHISSRGVSHLFGKSHLQVLSLVRELRLKNTVAYEVFQESSYINNKGIEQREVLMSQCGFNLLTINFLEERDVKIKEEYNRRFKNKRERLIANCLW